MSRLLTEARLVVKGTSILLPTILFGVFIAVFSWWWLILQVIVTAYFWGRLLSDLEDRQVGRTLRRPTSDLLRYPLFDALLVACVYADLIAVGWGFVALMITVLLALFLVSFAVSFVILKNDFVSTKMRNLFYGPWNSKRDEVSAGSQPTKKPGGGKTLGLVKK